MHRPLILFALAALLLLPGCSAERSTPVPSPIATAPAQTPSADPDEPIFYVVQVSEVCDEVYANALSHADSDSEFGRAMRVAAFACEGPDDWAAAVYLHPEVLGPNNLNDEYVLSALEASCQSFEMNEAPACWLAVDWGLFGEPRNWITV